MPVRKLKKSYRNVTGLFYSNRLRRLVQFDSMLERDFILILDIHPAVRWFAKVALARKLAVRLYWMLRKEWDYEQLRKFGSHAGKPGSGDGVR